MKKCTKCCTEKPKTSFYKRSYRLKSGEKQYSLDSFCIECRLAHSKNGWAKRRKEGEPEAVAGDIINGMRDRTKKKGYREDVEWTKEEVLGILNEGFCCKTGIPFRLAAGTSTHRNAFGPSPDRIDSSKGYTKENTQFVVYIYNAMRNNFKDEDIAFFLSSLKEV